MKVTITLAELIEGYFTAWSEGIGDDSAGICKYMEKYGMDSTIFDNTEIEILLPKD